MKNRSTKVLALALLFVLIAGTVLPCFAAEEAPYLITGSGILYLTVGKCPVVIGNLQSDAKSFSVTSSKPSVLKVGKEDGFGPISWWMKPVKTGTARITVKYKSGGKTWKVSGKFQVKEYPNPFAWIKINGKKIDLSKNRSMYMNTKYTKKSITIDYKLKSGWKKVSLGGCRIKGDDWIDVSWKKNKALSLKGYDAADLLISLKNAKTGETCDYEIVVTN